MTKTITLTEWLDSLSPRAKDIILDALNDADYKPTTEFNLTFDVDEMLKACILRDKSILSHFTERYSRYADTDEILAFCTALKFQSLGIISHPEYLGFLDKFLSDNYDIKYDNNELGLYLSLENRRALLNMPDGNYRGKVPAFIRKVILTDDFTNFKDKLDGNDCKFFKDHMDIANDFMNEDLVFDYYKKNPDEYTEYVYNNSKDKSMFYMLFFGKTGWSMDAKRKIIRNLFTGYSMHKVVEFFKHVVSVDPYWLHYLDRVLDCRGMPAHMYALTKDEVDLSNEEWDTYTDGNEYRFAKDIRKLAMIAHCCNRKSLPKTKNSTIGDAAALVRLYDYKFSDIVDCLYPDNIEPRFTLDNTITE